MRLIDRRKFLSRAAIVGAAAALGGCDRLSQNERVQEWLGSVDALNRWLQRRLGGKNALAREYAHADISPWFKPNGSTDPQDPKYLDLARNGFATWQMEVGGLVQRPGQFSLEQLRVMPSRTQITRHDCVEGWSCIAKWKGARLGPLLDQVGLKSDARFIVFYCADSLEESDSEDKYYESIDINDAYHPQTLLAYEMNGAPLTTPHGAPIRLRAERQLGYKMAKYVMRIEAVASYADIGDGQGGYWEDRQYAWYAGI